ncbi:MAG: hypothetical protein PHP23_02040 [Desulfobacterales bacterium]|nr:hypothetical protein [Desulfobacterales bacterium]MDD4070842.1 hypothetical protein [Desulfobacterales bacterium]MDD4391244.1 hypothetical protein [Desulfobacterales bacterium]
MSTDDLRKRYRQYHKERDRLWREYERAMDAFCAEMRKLPVLVRLKHYHQKPAPPRLPFPDELRGLT